MITNIKQLTDSIQLELKVHETTCLTSLDNSQVLKAQGAHAALTSLLQKIEDKQVEPRRGVQRRQA